MRRILIMLALLGLMASPAFAQVEITPGVFVNNAGVALGPIVPPTDGGATLGSALRSWSTLFLSKAGTIKWDGGAFTLSFPSASIALPAPVDGYLIASSGVGYKTVRDVWTVEVPTAICDKNTALTMLWSIPNPGGATPTCVAGANQIRGTLAYVDGSNSSAQTNVVLTPDYDSTGATTVKIFWASPAASGDVIWSVQTACINIGGSIDVAWNAAQTVTTTTAGASLRNMSLLTPLTVTGCVAGSSLYIKIDRDGTVGGDTLGDTARIARMEVSWFRKW